jgi:hypothetical protein
LNNPYRTINCDTVKFKLKELIFCSLLTNRPFRVTTSHSITKNHHTSYMIAVSEPSNSVITPPSPSYPIATGYPFYPFVYFRAEILLNEYFFSGTVPGTVPLLFQKTKVLMQISLKEREVCS